MSTNERPRRIALPITDGRLAEHFGRCEQFVIYETDPERGSAGPSEVLAAPPHQPGFLPGWLADKGVDVIIARGMGPRAVSAFEEHGIEVVLGASGEQANAIVLSYLSGDLESGANVCDH
jgi:ATP-binding protein involved in chromosome partitioning